MNFLLPNGGKIKTAKIFVSEVAFIKFVHFFEANQKAPMHARKMDGSGVVDFLLFSPRYGIHAEGQIRPSSPEKFVPLLL